MANSIEINGIQFAVGDAVVYHNGDAVVFAGRIVGFENDGLQVRISNSSKTKLVPLSCVLRA